MVEQAQFRKVEEESVVRRRLFADGSFSETFGYSVEEHGPIGTWINGKPIFRIVVLIPGGVGLSQVIVPVLDEIVEEITRASWSVVNGMNLSVNTGTEVAINLDFITAQLSVTHTGDDFTGLTVTAILEYTKI